MRLVFALPALLFSLACAGIFVEPTEGDYDAEVDDVEANDACGDSIDLGIYEGIDSVEVSINTASDEVTFGGDDGTECELTGASFACDIETEQDLSFEGFEYFLITTVAAEGKWTTSTTFDSDWEISIECDGADCETDVDPCVITYTLAGELDE